MSDADLDPQAAALLDELDAGVSPPSWTLSPDAGRALLGRLFEGAPSEEVEATTDTEIGGPNGPIPLRIYTPLPGDAPYPLFVHFHGGGWVRGSVDDYDPFLRRWANETGCLVVSVDYRRAPEHPFPVPFEDCYRAAAWAHEHAESLDADPDRTAVGGDSAGGNLAAAVTLAARDRDGPTFDHQTLVYPAVNPPEVRWFDSYDENGEGYFLEYRSMEWYYEQYLERESDLANAYAFPLRARDLSDLPSATVLTCGFDPLRDEGRAYADRLEDAGVPVTRLHYESQIHGLVNLGHHIDAADDAIVDLVGALRDAL
ncbi:alpha/beta hydrolase [Halospeciosus flavus]|uniref:Alpha/beta hydrolase n=1 Tax=Halospeciosus flavus TaxID=3032283 RepID=A0ABD5Z2K7_9EURY|nr:alpha/beta hydrolase [Halospeciosus flavus]